MNHAIILAAGSSSRFKKEDKLFAKAAGFPLIYYALCAFNDHPQIDSITVVVSKTTKPKIEKLLKEYVFVKVKKVVAGGKARQKSAENGLKQVFKNAAKEDVILVHNGANPLVTAEEIDKLIEKTQEIGAAIVGHKVASTIKEVDDMHIIKTHDRNKLFAAQTPQCGTKEVFEKALKNATKNKVVATDEAMLFEALGQKVAHVKADESNIKVTTQADLDRVKVTLGDVPTNFSVGFGQDSHKFDSKKKGLVLAGTTFKDFPKLEANSDGDVILHAIFNAISQAIGEKSLGFYADKMCEEGIKDSKKYLDVMLKKMKKKKLKFNSLGLMIECKKPKIDPLVTDLKKNLSKILGLHSRRIGITATTGEELTPFGQGKGIQCFAIISLTEDAK